MHPQSTKALPLRAVKAFQAQKKSTLWWVTPIPSPLCFYCRSAGIRKPTKTGFFQHSHSCETWPFGMLRDSSIHQKQQILLWHLCEGRSSVLAVKEQESVDLAFSNLLCPVLAQDIVLESWTRSRRNKKDLKAGQLCNSEQDKTLTLCPSHTDPQWFPSPSFHFPSQPTIPIITSLTTEYCPFYSHPSLARNYNNWNPFI